MLRVGLTGGLACGKSFVGRTLESFGCRVVRADDLGHQVLAPGGEAYEPVIQQFGEHILNADRSINRANLAAEVFGNPEKLAVLNALVHPAVFRREEEFIRSAETEDPNAMVVIEAAILIETGS